MTSAETSQLRLFCVIEAERVVQHYCLNAYEKECEGECTERKQQMYGCRPYARRDFPPSSASSLELIARAK